MAGVRDGIVKRGTTWSYVVRVTDPETGQSKPKWVGGFATEDEAKAARDEARVRARRGEYVDRSRITVEQYLDEWLEAHAVEIKPRTLAGYRDLLDRYVCPRIGKMRLQAVRPTTLSTLYRELHEGGSKTGGALSTRTVHHVHAILRKAFNDAVRVEQLLPSNPADRAKRPRTDRPGPGSVWSVDELRTFLRVSEAHRLHALFHLAAFTGARRGELLHLRWSDVDLDRPEINIRGTVAVIGGVRIEGTPKSGRTRVVSIDGGTATVLKLHRERQEADRLVAQEAWEGTGHVFATGFGLPIFPDSPSQLMPRLIAAHNSPAVPGKRGNPRQGLPRPAAPLPHARFHDLRHVHATMLLLAGVPVHVVAERLGHADPSITLRVYAHVIRQHAAGVADLFAGLVDPEDEL